MTEIAPAATTDSVSRGSNTTSGPNSTSGVVTTPSEVGVTSFKGTKHKIDFDGHEVELDYDTLVNDFKKHAKEAYQLRQQLNPVMEFVQSLQNGDARTLRQALRQVVKNPDVLREMSESELQEYIEFQNMDPRERALREREAKLEAIERQWKEQEEAQKRKAEEAERAQANEAVQRDLVEAIRDLGGDLKITPRMIRRVAEEAYARLEAGQKFDMKQIAKRQWEGLQSDYTEYQNLMLKRDPKAFISSLSPDLIKAIREHELAGSRPLKKVEHSDDSLIEKEMKKPSNEDPWKKLDRIMDKRRKQRMNA